MCRSEEGDRNVLRNFVFSICEGNIVEAVVQGENYVVKYKWYNCLLV